MPTERIPIKFDKGMALDYVPYEVPDGYALNISNAVVANEGEGLKSVALSSVANISGVTTQVLRGHIEVRASDDNLYWIFGTSDGKLWRCPATIGSTTATDITKSGAVYADAEWSFSQYGDWLIATNGVDAPQVLKGIASATNFIDLAGSPPTGKYVYLDNGHLIFLNIGTTVTLGQGNFSATGSWTGFGTVWTLTASQAVKFADGTTALEQNVSAIAAQTYKINFTIDNLPATTNAWNEVSITAVWRNSVAMSTSGTYQCVPTSGSFMYRTTDSGANWATFDVPGEMQTTYADMNGAGNIQYLLGLHIMRSTDSGSSFSTATASGVIGTGKTAIACTDDGTLVTCCTQSGFLNMIYKSTDYAGSFTSVFSQTLSGVFSKVVISRTNGSIMVAHMGASYTDNLYISTDTGATWNARGDKRTWSGVALSADGTKMYACVYGGYIYKSTDYGVTWVQKGSSKVYTNIFCSSDGTKVTAISTTYIYGSSDSGETWIQQGTNKHWVIGGMSGSGNKQVVGWQGTASASPAYSGTLYTYDTVSNTLVVGIGGASSDTITLEEKDYEVYIAATSTGNLKFTPSGTSRFTLDDVSVQAVGDGGKKATWSAYENIEDYTPSISTGADSQVFYEADGNIVGVARLGTRYAILFDRSLIVGQYIGGNLTFNFQKPLQGFTVASGGSGFNSNGIRWASVGDGLFFMGVDDIYWTDGASIRSITRGNRQNFFGTNRTIQASVMSDMKNNIVLFSKYDLGIGDPDGGTTHTHRILAYNYENQGWAHYAFVTDASYLSGSFPRLVTIKSSETVDRVLVGHLYKSSSSLVNYKYWDDGAFGEVIVKTKEIGNGTDIMTLTRVKPHYHLRESSTYPQVMVSYRMDEADDQMWTTEGSIGVNGFYDVIASGAFIGAKVTWKGPTTFSSEANISGCTFTIAKTGER